MGRLVDPPGAWLVAFRDSVRATRADAPLVGEVWEVAPIAGRYVPDALDLTFDFGFGTGVRLALENGRAGPLRTALSDSLRWWPANRNATFLSNHDQDRVMSQLRGDPASARLAAFLLLAAPGTPFLYYGEELGLEGRAGFYEARVTNQAGELIALFRGRSATVKGNWV